jgi:hypothetical protein
VSENTVGLDESIFDDDIDVDEIPDNPNHLPEDTYTCRIIKADLKPTKNGDKIGLTLNYQITEGPYSTAFPITEWLWCPRKPRKEDGSVDKDYEWTPEETRANSRLKKHFLAAGYGIDEVRKTKPSELIGKYIKVRTKNKTDDSGMERVNVAGVLAVSSGDGLDEFAGKNDDTDY